MQASYSKNLFIEIFAVFNCSLFHPMPKYKPTAKQQIQRYVQQYPEQFSYNSTNKLYCKWCNTFVDHERKTSVESHQKSNKHRQHAQPSNSTIVQTHIKPQENDFLNKLVEAFLSADIPLHKLKNKKIQELFNFMGYKLPPESSVRFYVLNEYKNKMITFLKEHFAKQKIVLSFDESEINSRKYFNVLANRLNKPSEIYIIDVVTLPVNLNMNSTLTKIYLERCLALYNLDFSNVMLLMSDAASYNIKAVKEIKREHPSIFHCTCLAHLVHNCAMKIKAFFANVDTCIGAIQMITTKNKTNKLLFASIGQPPKIIITRFSSWLRATAYYSNRLPEIKNIVANINDTGILTQRAKEALSNPHLVHDLITITQNYACLVDILDGFEDGLFTMESGYNVLMNIKLVNDPVAIKEYITSRLNNSDITKIMNPSDDTISPKYYVDLLNSMPTSLPVERSFSMLNKMLNYDRNFSENNVYAYFSYYFNSKVRQDQELKIEEEKM